MIQHYDYQQKLFLNSCIPSIQAINLNNVKVMKILITDKVLVKEAYKNNQSINIIN